MKRGSHSDCTISSLGSPPAPMGSNSDRAKAPSLQTTANALRSAEREGWALNDCQRGEAANGGFAA